MTLDIKSYFISINREILQRKIKDTLHRFRYRRCGEFAPKEAPMYDDIIDFDLALYLIDIIINSDCTKNFEYRGSAKERQALVPSKSLFNAKPHCGLPIGNLTSQLFSNIYLNSFDHYIKRTLKQKYYGRYVDDFYVVAKSKKELKEVKQHAEWFLKNDVKLELHPNKIHLQHFTKGVRYIGAVLYPYNIQADRRVKRAFVLLMDEIITSADNSNADPYILQENLQRAISYRGYLSHFKSFGLTGGR